MTKEQRAKAAKYHREVMNKRWKLVRVPVELHARLVATGKPINKAISDALDNQKD